MDPRLPVIMCRERYVQDLKNCVKIEDNTWHLVDMHKSRRYVIYLTKDCIEIILNPL